MTNTQEQLLTKYIEDLTGYCLTEDQINVVEAIVLGGEDVINKKDDRNWVGDNKKRTFEKVEEPKKEIDFGTKNVWFDFIVGANEDIPI